MGFSRLGLPFRGPMVVSGLDRTDEGVGLLVPPPTCAKLGCTKLMVSSKALDNDTHRKAQSLPSRKTSPFV
jgi:hypothetical protein